MSVPPPHDPAYQEPLTPPYGTAAGARAHYPEYPPYLPPMPYPYAPGPYPPYRPPQTNGLAIAALICAFLFAPLGIVFGHISLSQIKRSGEDGRGMAVAGLVIGYIVTIGTILALIAGALFISWAAKVVRENPQFRGAMASGQLPAFAPPTATPAGRPVVPPPAGAALDRALAKPVTYPRGTLAMADSGPASNGSQFLIVYPDSELPPTYTVFGKVGEKSLDGVDTLVAGAVDDGADDGES